MAKIELTHQEAVILGNTLAYLKDKYFDELDDVPKKGVSIINPDWIKQIYEKTQNQIDSETGTEFNK